MADVEYWRARCEATRRVRADPSVPHVVAAPAPDYAVGMLKVGVAMHHLEEALPGRQAGRIVPALGALLEGVADLLAWAEHGAHLNCQVGLPPEAYARLVGLIAEVAEDDGTVVTLNEVHLKPLAMGHYVLEAAAREKRMLQASLARVDSIEKSLAVARAEARAWGVTTSAPERSSGARPLDLSEDKWG